MNEDSGKGYGRFVMLVSGVSMVFSVVALLRHDNWDCEISPAGFVIATLSALITFLVAWQIWQTMVSRREIEQAKEVSRKIIELESRLKATSDLFTQRNMEIGQLIDAHAQLQAARDSDFFSDRYIHLAEALNDFIRSNVSIDYRPFIETRIALNDTLALLASEGSQEDKDIFLESYDAYEELHNNIMASIHKRQQDIDSLRRLVVDLRDQRRALRSQLLSSTNPRSTTKE